MPNVIDGNGIQIETYPEIIADIINGTSSVPGLVSIYGADINTGSNTPDGNFVNIFALSKEDILQLCVAIYDSFDPDEAVGVALDNLSQLCGISRLGGSYTQTYITVTVTGAVNITGLNGAPLSPFTISDANGNQYNLVTSYSFGSAGSASLLFQAANVGFIQVIPNTITNIVTITPNVATVNNPSTPTLIGEDQETDAAFRIRRQASVALPAQGAFYGLYAGLLTVPGLLQTVIYNNTSNSTNGYGVPPHSIWVIVNGGASGSVANTIYQYLNMGCGMYGTSSYVVTPVYGTAMTINFSTAGYQNFYAKMHLSSKAGLAINSSGVQQYLSTNYTLGIYQAADITTLDSLIHNYSSDLIASSLGVSLTNSSYGTSVWPSAFNNLLQLPSTNIILT